MYLGQDELVPMGRIAASESTAGGGWFGDALERGSRILQNILPGVASVIQSTKGGYLYGPAAPGGGAGRTHRYGYPDGYPGQPPSKPGDQLPTWFVPAALGIGGVLVFSMLTGKRRVRR